MADTGPANRIIVKVDLEGVGLTKDDFDVQDSTYTTDKIPMRLILWDDQDKGSNELRFVFDARAGKVTHVLKDDEKE